MANVTPFIETLAGIVRKAQAGDALADESGGALGGEANPDLISQAEAEGGTDENERLISGLRLAQAIAALESGGGGGVTVEHIVTQISGSTVNEYTLPADTLDTDGQALIMFVQWFGSSSRSAQTRWNGVSTITTSNSGSHRFGFMQIVRTGASAQEVGSFIGPQGAADQRAATADHTGTIIMGARSGGTIYKPVAITILKVSGGA